MSENVPSLSDAEVLNRDVCVYALDDGHLTAVAGVVTQARDGDFTLRTTGSQVLRPGGVAVMRVRTPDGVFRGRVEIGDVGDFVARVRLLEPMRPTERRAHARADIVVRFLVRRLPAGHDGGRVSRHLSLVPEQSPWITDEIVLSASGMRAVLPGEWRVRDRVEMRLLVPGPAGGNHLVLRGEIVRDFADDNPREVAVRFIDVDPATRLELVDIVDRARLADFLELES
jgi:hypothetical protein